MGRVYKFFFCMLITLLCLTASAAMAWQTEVIGEPYDWQYEDSQKRIVVNRVSEGNVVYFAAEVQLTDISGFRTECDSSLAAVSDLANRAGAVLAINGDDYATHKYGVIIRNGELLRAHDTTRNLLLVDGNGDMSVRVDRKGEDYKGLGNQWISEGAWQTFEFGPALVENGQALAFSPSFDVISTKASRLEPRTAIGQIGPLHYIIIVVDGRQDGYSVGMSLPDLQQLMIDYGAQTALNLDGGGSAEIWFQGQILNKPAGGQERQVSDIICF
ncbi:MAG: phosphodiester glycosidase family protein [Eubacteriales bacterium]|nr:phosphodiester glycosidase family protein [Eubacteriales bacterium]